MLSSNRSWDKISSLSIPHNNSMSIFIWANAMTLLSTVSRLWEKLLLLLSKDLKECSLILDICAFKFLVFPIYCSFLNDKYSFFSGFKYIKDFPVRFFMYNYFSHTERCWHNSEFALHSFRKYSSSSFSFFVMDKVISNSVKHFFLFCWGGRFLDYLNAEQRRDHFIWSPRMLCKQANKKLQIL